MTLIRYVRHCGIQIVIGKLGQDVDSVRTAIETRHHMIGKQKIICVASALFKIHLTYYLCPIRGSRHGRGCGKGVSLDIQIQKVEIKKKLVTRFSDYGDRGAYSLILCLPSTYNCLLLLSAHTSFWQTSICWTEKICRLTNGQSGELFGRPIGRPLGKPKAFRWAVSKVAMHVASQAISEALDRRAVRHAVSHVVRQAISQARR